MKIALLMLLALRQGAGSSLWSVTFENPDPCAAAGSSVEFRCFYNYSDGQTVHKAAWSKGLMRDGRFTRVDLSHIPTYQNRSEYIGDLRHDCSLALRELDQSDSGHYFFSFSTQSFGPQSRKSVYLTVTDLKASVQPARVEVGSSVSLQCSTSCEHAEVLWFKDGEPTSQTEFQARPQDAGSYACALEGQEWARSDPVALEVQHRPANVSVSMQPLRVSAGDSVNLTCSSDSNPPADDYTWYRRTPPTSGSVQQVGSGQVLSVLAAEAAHSGAYLCRARNRVGEGNSTEVLLSVEEATHTGSLILLITFGLKIVIIISLTLVLVWFCRSQRTKNTYLEDPEDNSLDNDYATCD